MSERTVWQILREDLKFYTHKIAVIQELQEQDFGAVASHVEEDQSRS